MPSLVGSEMCIRDRNKDLWYFIQQIDGVISIAGSRNAPLPMRKREVEDLLPLLDAEAVAARPKVEFAVGDPVRVCEGPFQSQEGTIEEIDPEKGKLRVSVSIFGRATPVSYTHLTLPTLDSV